MPRADQAQPLQHGKRSVWNTGRRHALDGFEEVDALEAAERDYGVVFEGVLADDTLAVDHAATKALRGCKRSRATRGEAQPSEVGRA